MAGSERLGTFPGLVPPELTGWDVSTNRSKHFKPGADGQPPALHEVFAALVPEVDLQALHGSPSDVLRTRDLPTHGDLVFRPTSAQILNPLAA
jgi:hypothetical protein